MVDKPILWSIMLRLQCPEQRLLRSENLHGGSWVLGQVHQASCMTDKPRPDELADHRSQIRRDGLHSIPEVL